MITEKTWHDKNLDWVSEKIIEIIVDGEKKGAPHVREGIIFRVLVHSQYFSDVDKREWGEQNPGYLVLGRKKRTSLVRKAIRRLTRCGKIIVVNRFPMRDERFLGRGKEELVFALGGVLDELASVLGRQEDA